MTPTEQQEKEIREEAELALHEQATSAWNESGFNTVPKRQSMCVEKYSTMGLFRIFKSAWLSSHAAAMQKREEEVIDLKHERDNACEVICCVQEKREELEKELAGYKERALLYAMAAGHFIAKIADLNAELAAAKERGDLLKKGLESVENNSPQWNIGSIIARQTLAAYEASGKEVPK